MIKIILALLPGIAPLCIFCQNFQASEDFKISGLEYQQRIDFMNHGDLEKDTIVANLVRSKKQSKIIISYKLPYIETLDSFYVKEWVNPGYKNVDRILCVQFDYAACCYDYQGYYFIVTKKGKLIPLTPVFFSMCDYPGEIEEYEFNAEKGIFYRVVNMYVDQDSVISRVEKEVLFWDGKRLTSP